VFSTFGMKANTGWVYHFHKMLARLESGPDDSRSSLTLLGRLRDGVPRQWLMKGSDLLPPVVRSYFMRLLTSRLRDWSRTPYLAVSSEQEGFVRINFAGRESCGIVAPGAEQEALIARLQRDLVSFRDLDSDLPVVDQITEVDDLVRGDVAERYWLPDLIVSWTDAISAQASCGVRSDTVGEVRWRKGAPHASGGSGKHHGTGWYVAAGPGISTRADEEVRDPIDLAPTVLQWLGLSTPGDFDGLAIKTLAA
jgi:predicted AlkP superfamily phosphohydrolase/phosphomutase